MKKSILAVIVLLSLCRVVGAAPRSAIVTTQDGRVIEGDLLGFAEGRYRLRCDQRELSLARSEVARIAFLLAPKRISLSCVQVPLRTVLGELAEKAAINLIIGPEFSERKVSVTVRKEPWLEVLAGLLNARESVIRVDPDVVIVAARSPKDFRVFGGRFGLPTNARRHFQSDQSLTLKAPGPTTLKSLLGKLCGGAKVELPEAIGARPGGLYLTSLAPFKALDLLCRAYQLEGRYDGERFEVRPERGVSPRTRSLVGSFRNLSVACQELLGGTPKAAWGAEIWLQRPGQPGWVSLSSSARAAEFTALRQRLGRRFSDGQLSALEFLPQQQLPGPIQKSFAEGALRRVWRSGECSVEVYCRSEGRVVEIVRVEAPDLGPKPESQPKPPITLPDALKERVAQVVGAFQSGSLDDLADSLIDPDPDLRALKARLLVHAYGREPLAAKLGALSEGRFQLLLGKTLKVREAPLWALVSKELGAILSEVGTIPKEQRAQRVRALWPELKAAVVAKRRQWDFQMLAGRWYLVWSLGSGFEELWREQRRAELRSNYAIAARAMRALEALRERKVSALVGLMRPDAEAQRRLLQRLENFQLKEFRVERVTEVNQRAYVDLRSTARFKEPGAVSTLAQGWVARRRQQVVIGWHRKAGWVLDPDSLSWFGDELYDLRLGRKVALSKQRSGPEACLEDALRACREGREESLAGLLHDPDPVIRRFKARLYAKGLSLDSWNLDGLKKGAVTVAGRLDATALVDAFLRGGPDLYKYTSKRVDRRKALAELSGLMLAALRSPKLVKRLDSWALELPVGPTLETLFAAYRASRGDLHGANGAIAAARSVLKALQESDVKAFRDRYLDFYEPKRAFQLLSYMKYLKLRKAVVVSVEPSDSSPVAHVVINWQASFNSGDFQREMVTLNWRSDRGLGWEDVIRQYDERRVPQRLQSFRLVRYGRRWWFDADSPSWIKPFREQSERIYRRAPFGDQTVAWAVKGLFAAWKAGDAMGVANYLADEGHEDRLQKACWLVDAIRIKSFETRHFDIKELKASVEVSLKTEVDREAFAAVLFALGLKNRGSDLSERLRAELKLESERFARIIERSLAKTPRRRFRLSGRPKAGWTVDFDFGDWARPDDGAWDRVFLSPEQRVR